MIGMYAESQLMTLLIAFWGWTSVTSFKSSLPLFFLKFSIFYKHLAHGP